jgi:succinate dehydrogenase / fumarate reductase cytochrome b subunit
VKVIGPARGGVRPRLAPGACALSVLKLLRSSIGKKYVMGLTGLFLCLFLVIHLAGNILLYADGTGELYNAYAHKLHGTPAFLYFSEFLLYSAIAIHLYLAYTTATQNWRARGDVSYSSKRTKIYNRTLAVHAESIMFFTGAMVFLFMAIHIADFKYELGWRQQTEGLEPYDKALVIMGNMFRKIVYVIGSLFVGLHVVHGFRSALQSLGINHPKYNRLFQRLSVAFAIVVAVGFASFPLWFSGDRNTAAVVLPQPSDAPSEPTQP